MRIVFVSALAALVLMCAALLAILLGWLPAKEPPANDSEAALAALAQEVRGLADAQTVRRRQIEALESRIEAVSSRVAELEAAPAHAGDARRGEPAEDEAVETSDPTEPQSTAPEPSREDELAEAFEVLLDPEARGAERQRVWNALAGRGLLDDALAFFEARARENPRDPGAHADLGHAYLQKLLTAGDLEKGRWAMKADRAYDQALALDPRHWEARFAKAMSYSFWPPVMGMQPKAIEQFETLRAQQEEGPPRPEFADTYLYLGNLHASGGNSAKAEEAWRRGLELFPDHEELRVKATPQEGGEG